MSGGFSDRWDDDVQKLPAIKTAWLVEQRDDHGPSWLTGPAPGYAQGTLPFVFSYDANDAVQFARERDAAEMAAYMGPEARYFATEHQWS